MILNKLKTVHVVMFVVLGVIAYGVPFFIPDGTKEQETKVEQEQQRLANREPEPCTGTEAAQEKLDEELMKLQGSWSLVLQQWKGHDVDDGPATLSVKGDACSVLWEKGAKKATWTIKIAPPSCTSPVVGAARLTKAMDFLWGGETVRGIYKLEEDTLVICQAPSGKERPHRFAAEAEGDDALFVFGRLRTADNIDKKVVTRVVSDISEGPAAKISDIEFKFVGANTSAISPGHFKFQTNSSSAVFGTLIGGDYNPINVDQDATKLSEYFHNHGYLDARVQRELIWSDNYRSVKVIFHIEEGNRF